MSLKDLFKEDLNLQSFEPLTKQDISGEVESYDYIKAVQERNNRFLPFQDFSKPETFAKFGLAEKYYEDSIARIFNTYPYDGSLKEKVLWESSSSLIDLYLLENGYPRTTGFITFQTSSIPAVTTVSGYGGVATASYSFIFAKGGPNAGVGDSLHYDQWQDTIVFRKNANIFNVSQNRENNLKVDGNDGNTVEFWLKKGGFDIASTANEVIVDVFVTGTTEASADYGRLRIELTGTNVANTSPFLVTYMSGTTGIGDAVSIGSNITTSSVADDQWHHYSFRFANSGSTVVTDLFMDGAHNHRLITGSTVDYVSGALVATVGALGMAPSGVVGPSRGWAKLSASMDEFRYWKTERTSKKIQQYWFDQVGGGTNSDIANTDLGLYYKFNEGITQNDSIDSIVLDYSGRISNGVWTGYDANYSRSTGSAILESSASTIEFRDPIIYSSNPLVTSFLNNKKNEGRNHDYTNVNSIMSYVPSWMLEANETSEDDSNQNVLLNLLQILSSYFDNASLLIDTLPSLSEQKYYSSGTFPPPFNIKALESTGFVVPDLFIDLSLLEEFADRNNELKFVDRVDQVKRVIYQNIYNNLVYLYKSKGTEKSFRNLIRCFGTDDEILKFNLYTQNNTFRIEDNTRYVTKTTQFANFNTIPSGDATIYQFTASGDTNATSFISSSADDYATGLAFTLEADVILPNRVSIGEYATVKSGSGGKAENFYPLIATSSLFGIHNATATENDTTWEVNDFANFQVYTIKENDDQFSSTAKFVLSGTAGSVILGAGPLESPFFEDVYDDQRWTLAVSVAPQDYGTNQVSGTADPNLLVRFYGTNHISDLKFQSFEVSGVLGPSPGVRFWGQRKRVFAGAHRTNFTGSTREFSDVKISQVKAWLRDVPTASVDQHNKKIGNYGTEAPIENQFLYETAVNSVNIPQLSTLALHWDFSLVTGSNASGQFFVEDASSGSATDNRYGDFSNVITRRHPARGDFFAASSTNAVINVARGTLKQQVPEVLMDSNLTRILTDDDRYISRDRLRRPITYHFSLEKNLFQSISEEMLDMFASIEYMNTLVGNPVNLYRGEYKELGKLRELFFEKVGNDYDFDKYVEYYKYIDYAIGKYVEKLIPASLSTFRKGIATIVENFALDRNKYRNKFPIVKDKMPPKFEAQALGINELLYDWKYCHAPFAAVASSSSVSSSYMIALSGAITASLTDFTGALDPAIWVTASADQMVKRDRTASKWSVALSGTGEGGSLLHNRWLSTAVSFKAPLKVSFEIIAGHSPDGINCFYDSASYGGAYPGLNLTQPESEFGGPDHEDVKFQYSTDGGTLWTTQEIFYGSGSNDPANPPWNDVAWSSKNCATTPVMPANRCSDVVIPPPADCYFTTEHTFADPGQYHFRWIQENFEGVAQDAWAISNVIIKTSSLFYDTMDDNCCWWLERAERDDWLQSGTSSVDSDKQIILDSIVNETNAPAPILTKTSSAGTLMYSGSTYVTRRLAKPYKITSGQSPNYHGGSNFYQNKKYDIVNTTTLKDAPNNALEIGNLEAFKDCNDRLDLGKKRKFKYEAVIGELVSGTQQNYFRAKGDLFAPLNLYSSSVAGGYHDTIATQFMSGVDITNLHDDTYGDYYVTPMQGPFAEKYVGGYQYRHIDLNYSGPTHPLDTLATRPEGRFLQFTGSNQLWIYGNWINCIGSGNINSFANSKHIDFDTQYLSSSEVPGGPSGFDVDAFTVSAWLRPTSLAAPRQMLVQHGTPVGGAVGKWLFGLRGSLLEVSIFSDTGADSKLYQSTNLFTINNWHHAALTFNSSSQDLTLYINGISESVAKVDDDPINFNLVTPVTSSIIVGGNAFVSLAPTSLFYTGSLDEISFWDTDLNAAAIKEIFITQGQCSTPTSGPNNLNIHSKAANLVSWWRMGDDSLDNVFPGTVDGVRDVGLNANNNHLSVPIAPFDPVSSSANFLTGAIWATSNFAAPPPAFRTREPLAKRPVNIANIKQTTGSSPTKIGNYEHEYDIVQAGGRTINNVFFIKNNGIQLPEGATGLVYSLGLDTPLLDYTLPDRSGTGSNKFVFANRFSAPGGPETLSPGFLDAEAAEFSVYNALPFRNLSVRLPLQELLTDHCKQFGYFSDMQNFMNYQSALMGMFDGSGSVPVYPGSSGSVTALSYAGSASFHKVNRNPLRSPYKCYPPGTCAITGTWSNSKAVLFDYASAQYLISSTSPVGFASSDDFSVSTWVKFTNGAAWGAAEQTIASHGDIAGPPFKSARWSTAVTNTGRLLVEIYNTGSFIAGQRKQYTTAAPVFSTDTWYHAAFTFASSSSPQLLQLYVDGLPQAVTKVDDSEIQELSASTDPLVLADTLESGSVVGLITLDGVIDEFSYWNAALSSGEVLEIYNSPQYCTSGPNNLNLHSKVNNLVSWYRMGDASGDDCSAGVIGGIKDVAIGLSAGGNDLNVPLAAQNPITSSANFLTGAAYKLDPSNKGYTGCEEKVFDNAYVQHQIPRSDVQYTWITASLVDGYTGSALYGFEEPNYSLASMASTDLTFCSASDYGSFLVDALGIHRWFGGTPQYAAIYAGGHVPTDFVGMNFNIYEPISSSTNTLGYPSLTEVVSSFDVLIPGATIFNYNNYSFIDGAVITTPAPLISSARALNSIILHRQGPYGWPIWKQVRGAQHPIARYQRNNNIIQYMRTKMTSADPMDPLTIPVPIIVPSINYTEPPLSSKYKPLIFVVPSHSPKKFALSTFKTALGNALVKFTDHRNAMTPSLNVVLDSRINTVPLQTYSSYFALKTLLVSSSYKSDDKRFINVAYNETIYPKEQYTYLGSSRKRENFVNTFWRDQRADRTVLDQPNSLSGALVVPEASFGASNIGTASMWNLDAHLNFNNSPGADDPDWTSARLTSGSNANVASLVPGSIVPGDGAGELQNNYCLYSAPLSPTGNCGFAYRPPRAACEYARRIPYVDQQFVTGSDYLGPTDRSGSLISPPASPTGSSWPPFTEFIMPSTSSTSGPSPNGLWYMFDTVIVGDTLWEVPKGSPLNYKPFYDSYDDYVEDLFRLSKDATIIPEFRISEHIDLYVNGGAKLMNLEGTDINGASWGAVDPTQATLRNLLTLTGSSVAAQTDAFLNRYVFSDFLKHFKLVKEDYQDDRENPWDDFKGSDPVPPLGSTRFKIACEASIKFLPYDGFYPAERTVQLATLFSQSVNATFTSSSIEGSGNFRTLMQPFFAPGIMYNTIKSGIAVDYPIYTTGAEIDGGGNVVAGTGPIFEEYTVNAAGFKGPIAWQAVLSGAVTQNSLSGAFNARVPFEALYGLPNYSTTIVDAEPACRARIESTASLTQIGPQFRAAMHNFLAEVVNTFLDEGNVTQLMSSEHKLSANTNEVKISVPKTQVYSMDLILRNSFNYQHVSDFQIGFNSIATRPNLPVMTPIKSVNCSLNHNRPSITMYSRAITGYTIDPFLYGSSFGPPCAGPQMADAQSRPAWIMSSFEPYTPPYYDGFCAARITASLEKKEYTLDEIVGELGYEYFRLPTFGTGTMAYENAMQIDASINIKAPKGLLEETDAYGKPKINLSPASIIFKGTSPKGETKTRIVFSPKFECPILDFNNVSPTLPEIVEYATASHGHAILGGTIAKGMWHQYGQIPQPKGKDSVPGIVLDLQEGPTDVGGDLRGLLGLTNVDPQSLGRLGTTTVVNNKKKTFSEALVAIPFKYNSVDDTTNLYKILPQQVNGGTYAGLEYTGVRTLFMDPNAPSRVVDYWNLQPSTSKAYAQENPEKGMYNVDPAVYELLQKMHKYVIPPHLDFLHNENIDPFVMYMWEFEVDLQREDLQNMWQNVTPRFAQTQGKKTINISESMIKAQSKIIRHVMPTTEHQQKAGLKFFGEQSGISAAGPEHDFFYQQFDETVTRWAVFKVKRRARNNYNNVVGRVKGEEYLVREDLDNPTDYPYSYNWPHDFYSLIELAKIETGTNFGKLVKDLKKSQIVPMTDFIYSGLDKAVAIATAIANKDNPPPPEGD